MAGIGIFVRENTIRMRIQFEFSADGPEDVSGSVRNAIQCGPCRPKPVAALAR
jgi:hypothetical protein